MKKRDRSVEVADLNAIAHADEDLVLFIHRDELNIPSSLCVRANFDTQTFDEVQPLADYLQSDSYDSIDDGDTQMSYRQRIHEEMKPDMIKAMLLDFTQKRQLKLENEAFLSKEPSGWKPGG